MLQVIKIMVIVLAVLLILYLLAIMPRMIHRAEVEPFKGRLYAHRGLYDNRTEAPENSMAAFQKAVDNNYGIELDIQLTKDNVIVVCHDADIKRVCGVDKMIRALTFEELQQYTLYDSKEKIPTFSDVLALVDGRVPLIVEYKSENTDTLLFELGDEMLRNYHGLYCVESFNPLLAFWYRRHNKDVMRGILSDAYKKEGIKGLPNWMYATMQHLLLNFIIKPDFVAYHHIYYRNLSRTLCHKLYHATAVAWTIQSQQQLRDREKHFDLFIFDSFIPEE